MAGVSLSGMASGLNTDDIISKLMAVEGQGKTRLIADQYRAEARKTALDQVATKLRSLSTAIGDLRSVSTWKSVQTVESSDSAKVSATYTGGAGVGSYSLEVQRLARADQQFHTYSATGSQTTLNLQYTGDASSAVAIDIPANATAEEVASAINGKVGSPAYASVVEGKLVLSGKKTGVNLEVTSPQLVEDPSKRREARTAQYSIDGVTQPESASNTITTGLPGVTMTLKALTTNPVNVNVGAPGPDSKAVQDKVKAFVDAYNSTIDLVNGKLTEQTVTQPQTTSDYGKGALRGDPGLQAVLSNLRNLMGAKVAGNPDDFDQLSDIGVSVPKASSTGTTSVEARAGKLVIDTEKLTAAITADPIAIRRMMGGVSGVDGFTQKLDAILDPVAKLSTGSLAERSTQIGREIDRIKDRQKDMDKRLELKEERLRKQFTAMETALSSAQSTQSWISSQIAGMGA